MNCKQGDLAIVVAGNPNNLGKPVTCLRFIPKGARTPSKAVAVHDGWETDIPLHVTWTFPSGKEVKGMSNYSGDCYLRPIRDAPGEDETITWAGKPEKVQA